MICWLCYFWPVATWECTVEDDAHLVVVGKQEKEEDIVRSLTFPTRACH
jgi:hypothetical protein